jgi:hypothetical protein
MKWPRFSLRMLFVLVEIAAVPMGWVTYQLNWIRQRHELISRYEVQVDVDFFTIPGDPPWSLRLFGETPRRDLVVRTEHVKEAARLFPEARIWDAKQFIQEGLVHF